MPKAHHLRAIARGFTAALCLAAMAGLSSCGPTEAVGAAPARAAAPRPPAPMSSGDCAEQKRQLDALSSTGQGHTSAYRTALDRYLARCF